MEKETEVKKIVVTIEGKDHIWNIEAAKKLHKALSELFKERVVEKVVEHHNWPYRYFWDYKFEQTPTPNRNPYREQIWCMAKDNTAKLQIE